MTVGRPPLSTRKTLANGTRVHLQAIEHSDQAALREELFLKLSLDSLRNRFFAIKPDLSPAELSYLCDVDFLQHVAIVARVECASRSRLVGVTRFVRATHSSENAELAIAVVDQFQGLGIGRLLLSRLIVSARELGITQFEGSMLAQNTRMASLVRQTRLPVVLSREHDIISMSMALS